MKTRLILFALLFITILTRCDKYDGDSYDFSDSLPNYVEFASVKALSVASGAKAPFKIITRSAFFKDTQVSVKIEGAGFNETKTIVLPKMKLDVSDYFTIPTTAVVGTDFTITIVSAQTEGVEVRVGRINSKTIIKGKVAAS
ncbi:MAG: hypothetical protein PHQ11_06740 [Paludibacter sp.]|nr:hypothetical protein [Paludibacter sp.]